MTPTFTFCFVFCCFVHLLAVLEGSLLTNELLVCVVSPLLYCGALLFLPGLRLPPCCVLM